MPLTSCPLCSSSVPSSSLELHLRRDLSYTPFLCLLCSLRFFTRRDAVEHFRGRFGEHRGVRELRVAMLRDEGKERRLAELLDEAESMDTSGAGKDDLESEGKLAADNEALPRQSDELKTLEAGQSFGALNIAEMRQSPLNINDTVVSAKATFDAGNTDQEEPIPEMEYVSDLPKPVHNDKSELYTEESLTKRDDALPVPIQDSEKESLPEPVAGIEDGSSTFVSSIEPYPIKGNRQERPSQMCLLCGSVVGYSGNRDHVLAHHYRKAAFACRLCGRDFRQARNTRNHLLDEHAALMTATTVQRRLKSNDVDLKATFEKCFPTRENSKNCCKCGVIQERSRNQHVLRL